MSHSPPQWRGWVPPRELAQQGRGMMLNKKLAVKRSGPTDINHSLENVEKNHKQNLGQKVCDKYYLRFLKNINKNFLKQIF
jgi:hypothetical protein